MYSFRVSIFPKSISLSIDDERFCEHESEGGGG